MVSFTSGQGETAGGGCGGSVEGNFERPVTQRPHRVREEREMRRGLRAIVGAAVLAVAANPLHAITIDFGSDPGGSPLSPGSILTEQLAGWGVHVWADNATPGHPDVATVFDSGNPTGADFDLATPGYHPSNKSFLGNLLILAEDAVDANGDGLIDSPDDEGNRPGGMIGFTFDTLQQSASLLFVDIEESNGWIDFLWDGAVVGSTGMPALGDNAVSSAEFTGSPFNALNIHLAGSGAIAQIGLTEYTDPDDTGQPPPEIPEPTTIMLFGAAGVAFLRSRRM